MRYFISKGNKKVIQKGNRNGFTLSQFHPLFNDDGYCITRCVATKNLEESDGIPERDFYIYKITYYLRNDTFKTVYVDEEVLADIIYNNVEDFLTGKAHEVLANYFDKVYVGGF